MAVGFLAKISGLHCSLCTGTIEKALGRLPGVYKVAVSLTHEQALVEFNPAVITPQEILRTLKDIGYTVYDPRKVRPYEEEEAELAREGKRLLAATGLSLITIALILLVLAPGHCYSTGLWRLRSGPSRSCILRAQGLGRAVLGTAGFAAVAALVLVAKESGVVESAAPWIIGAFALFVLFGLAGAFPPDGVPVDPPRHPQPACPARVRRLRGPHRRRPRAHPAAPGLPDRAVLRRHRLHRELPHLLRVAVAFGQDAQLPGGQAPTRPAARHGTGRAR